MALQGVPPKGEEKGLAPPGVEGGRDVELKRDEGADVLHRDRLRVKVEERGGLVLSNGVVGGFIVDGGERDVVVVAVGRRRGVGRSAFPRSAVKSGAEASIGRITVCLCRGGLAFCLSRTGEGSVAGGLASVGKFRRSGGRHRPTIGMKRGRGRGRSVDIVAGHEQRLDDALEQRLDGALEAAPGAEERAWGRT